MKNILLVGASSKVSVDLIEKYSDDYNFISLSRNDNYSDYLKFDILDTLTFPEIDNLDGMIYFPGNINLKPFKRIKVDDFNEDYEKTLPIISNYYSDLGASEDLYKAFQRVKNTNPSNSCFSRVKQNHSKKYKKEQTLSVVASAESRKTMLKQYKLQTLSVVASAESRKTMQKQKKRNAASQGNSVLMSTDVY